MTWYSLDAAKWVAIVAPLPGVTRTESFACVMAQWPSYGTVQAATTSFSAVTHGASADAAMLGGTIDPDWI